MARLKWASVKVGRKTIPIYLDSSLDCFGWTWAYTDTPTCPHIDIHPRLLNHPKALDETLCHEFVHALEYIFAKELKKPNPKDCTRYAMVLGRYLPRMFNSLTLATIKKKT